jgi:hypothetical protein
MSAAKCGAVLLACLLSAIAITNSPAAACSCPVPPADAKGPLEKTWKLEHATDVVRGRITDVHAGDGITRGSRPMVVAKMNVSSIVKGDLPVGETTILTGFGTGDCGIAGVLLVSVAWQRDLILEVRQDPSFPGEFVADICGYGEVTPLNR